MYINICVCCFIFKRCKLLIVKTAYALTYNRYIVKVLIVNYYIFKLFFSENRDLSEIQNYIKRKNTLHVYICI